LVSQKMHQNHKMRLPRHRETYQPCLRLKPRLKFTWKIRLSKIKRKKRNKLTKKKRKLKKKPKLVMNQKLINNSPKKRR
jgi:hypothetical protein